MPTDEVMDLSTIRQCLASLRAEEGRVSAWRAQLQAAIDGYGKGVDELPEAFARDDPPRRGARATLRPVELHPLLQGDWPPPTVLKEAEKDLSAERRVLHRAIDALEDVIATRRLAEVDSRLRD